MRVHLATLGFTPRVVIPAIDACAKLDRVVLYHGKHKDSVAKVDEVGEHCRGLKIDFKPVKLDEFDFMGCAQQIKADIDTYRKKDDIVSFNIAGGTRVISSAALLISILEGVRTVFVHETTLEVVQLPLIEIRYVETLTPRQREMLEYLARQDAPVTQAQLAKGLKKHKATVTHHLNELVEKGVVLVETDADDSRVRRISILPSARLLLG